MHPKTLQQWLDYQQQLHPQAIDMGLARVREVYRRLLQNPAYSLEGRSTILVGGSNGKGSTATMLAKMYQSHHYKVGKYSSPHLWDYTERIKINERPVEHNLLLDAFSAIETARLQAEPISLSYFEFATLAALLIFARENVQILILEVGLGGRLDACNILDADLAIITSLSIDHVDYLGDDLNHIAIEKAHIFRKDQFAIYGGQKNSALEDFAYKLGAQFYWRGLDFSLDQNHLQFKFNAHHFQIYDPQFYAAPFYDNLSCALAALCLLQTKLPIDIAAATAALKDFKMAGRMQMTRYQNLDILLDVGHNAGACELIKNALIQHDKTRNIKIIIGMMRDKDIASCVRILSEISQRFYCCDLPIERAMHADALAKIIQKQNPNASVQTFGSVHDALSAASEQSAAHDLLVVLGSFYTVAGARAFLPNIGTEA